MAEGGEVTERKSFRFQNSRVLLTYKTHIPKEGVKEWAMRDLGCREVHIAHETGDEEHPYLHSHVIMEWEKAFQTRSERRFDYKDIHPHINPIKTRQHLENSYKYLCKEDHTCDYLLSKKTSAFSKRVWDCKTVQEALEGCERPSEVLGTIAMFKMKPREGFVQEIENFRPWQRLVLNIVRGEPDDRSILWIYDQEGGAGKSILCKYLMTHGMAYCITSFGTIRDLAEIVRTAMEKGWDGRVLTIDLPREAEVKHIYEPLEMLKNGMITAQKYQGETVCWKPGHVVVMANFLPQREKMTQDRWKIIEVE